MVASALDDCILFLYFVFVHVFIFVYRFVACMRLSDGDRCMYMPKISHSRIQLDICQCLSSC